MGTCAFMTYFFLCGFQYMQTRAVIERMVRYSLSIEVLLATFAVSLEGTEEI